MPYSAEDYLRDKEALESARRERDRAQGRLDAALKRLKDDHGCDNEKAARKLLARRKKEHEFLTEEIEAKRTAFQEKWGDRLN